MTSPIQSVGHLVSVIQDRLAARASAGSTTPIRVGMRRKAAASPETDLESLIGSRIKSIAPDDPRRGRKAFRVFLESVLLTRFGKDLMHDPKFYELVDSVQSAMEADEDIGVLVQAAVAVLLSSDSPNVT